MSYTIALKLSGETMATVVYVSEEYGYRNYLWTTTLSEEELIKEYQKEKEVSLNYFSALGFLKRFGGSWKEVFHDESPLYGWGEFVAKDGYENFKFWECPAAFEPIPKNCKDNYLHLHWEDDSYLKIGEKIYLHSGWTGRQP